MDRKYLDRNIRTARCNANSIANNTATKTIFIMRVMDGYYPLDVDGLNQQIQLAKSTGKDIGIVIDVVQAGGQE